MEQSSRGRESGFSLIELMIAMTITLVISGAMYGLIAGGQTAFRREPELSDRQQNIRVAMDLILRDVANAGSGLPSFIQTFTPGLDACAGCPDGGAPLGPDGDVTDELEMMTNTGARDNEPACHTAGGGSSTQVRLMRTTGTIPDDTVVILIMDDGTWTVMNVTDTTTNNTGADNCDAGVQHNALNFNTGNNDSSDMNVPGGVCQPNADGLGNATGPCSVQEVSFAEVVRYRIRDDADGVPVLQRRSTANFAAGFQTIARGIENLQVQYVRADVDPTIAANWVDGAPVTVPATPGSLISQVRVTLAARSEAENVQGMTDAPSARAALRGQLTATASPRSTLTALSIQQPTPLWR
ncbi:MAG TPA: prepilin-type N-terminal cleavage/methylation domain-containing protein [Vicinamibacteria bacterium]|nr:prepilin-type N-terminal cleavage/methylation domain-containing protein [Vicinamibacteria bacterium]